ncbi:MAG: TldD/PmbA family protein [Candidatus Micrarchaeota archaeon]|nr:TldD/PmbA family protein [Candidatus Micrarchaeota archaeon]
MPERENDVDWMVERNEKIITGGSSTRETIGPSERNGKIMAGDSRVREIAFGGARTRGTVGSDAGNEKIMVCGSRARENIVGGSRARENENDAGENNEKFVELALGLGADEAEIFFSSGFGYSISSRGRSIHSKSSSFSGGWGVRVLKKGKLGFSYFIRKPDAEKAASTAISIAKFSPLTPFSFPSAQAYRDASSFDPQIAGLTPDSASQMFAKALRSFPPASKPTECALGWGEGHMALANSNGLHAEERSTSISFYAQAESDGAAGYCSQSSQKIFGLEPIAGRAGSLAVQMRSPAKQEQGKEHVIFERDALHSLISSFLIPALDGDSARRKTTKLHSSLDVQIASPELTLADDPLSEGVDRCAFDGEGIASKPKKLIENGVLANFLFDLRTASLAPKQLRPSPGAASRPGFSSQVSPSPSNTVIAEGKIGNLAGEHASCLRVLSFFGSHTANVFSGDFSVSVDIGFQLRKGETVGAARGFIISGNIFELIKNIEIEKRASLIYDLTSPRIGAELTISA